MKSNTLKMLLVCAAALLGMLLFTRPDKLSSAMLVIPFLLFFIVIFLCLKLVFKSRRTEILVLVAGVLVVGLGLQSLGQLTLRDLVMLGILFVTSYFYMFRRAQTTK